MRKVNNLKLRQVAEAIGLKVSSYSNAESSNMKRMSESKVRALAGLYRLGGQETEALIELWREQPVSEYSQRQRDRWAERNARRNKARMADRLALSLVEILTAYLSDQDPATADRLCTCPEVDLMNDVTIDTYVDCEVCTALKLCGVKASIRDGLPPVVAELAAEQSRLLGGK